MGGRVVFDLPKLKELHTTMGDISPMANGEGGNRERGFELCADGRCVRGNRCHSVGSGVRPDVLPVTTQMKYLIHGTSLRADQAIVSEGLSRCGRFRIHFYECDLRGLALGGNTARHGCDVGVVAHLTHFVEDGIGFYRSSIDVFITEGINGVLGPQYIRYICALPRDPYSHRRAIWDKSSPDWKIEDIIHRNRAQTGAESSDEAASVATRANREVGAPSEPEESATPGCEAMDSDEELTMGSYQKRRKSEMGRYRG